MFFQSLIPFPGLRATFFGQFTWLVFSCFLYLAWYDINIDVTRIHLHQMTDWSMLISWVFHIECLVLLLSLPLSIHSSRNSLRKQLPGTRGVLLGILGGGVPQGSQNPDHISDQKRPLFTPFLRPGAGPVSRKSR